MTALQNRETLIRSVQQGFKPEFLFFWGHRSPRHEVIGKSCLSQWFPAGFERDGARYPTAEHYMMAGKARVFGDKEALAAILASSDPAQVKAWGRKIRNYDGTTWQQERFRIVVEGNLEKFSQNDRLRTYLLGTGSKILVEASPVDAIWGIGLAADAPDASHPDRWRGENLLGFALMQVREQLRAA